MGHVLGALGVQAAPCPWPPPQLLRAWFCPVGVRSHLSLSATPVLLELVSGSQNPFFPPGPPCRSPLGRGGHLGRSPAFLLEGRGRRRCGECRVTGRLGHPQLCGWGQWGEGARCLDAGMRPLGHPSPSLPRPPACNVTIHNRCKDTLANCTKVKQKVSWRAAGWGEGRVPALSVHSSPVLTAGQPAPCAPGPGPRVASLLLWTQPWLWARCPSCPGSLCPVGPAPSSCPPPPPAPPPPPVGVTLGDSCPPCLSFTLSHSNRKPPC